MVLGNGPSRDGMADAIAAFDGVLIACNGFWMEGIRDPDWTVAFDGKDHGDRRGPIRQFVEDAPDHLQLIVPDPVGCPSTRKVARTVWERAEQRSGGVILATPFCANAIWSQDHGTYCTVVWVEGERIGRLREQLHQVAPGHGWHPRQLGWGNLSGFIAMQLAVMLGCNPIYLLGIDVSGRAREDGTVGLTARCPDRDPLVKTGSWTVRKSEAVEVRPGWWQPAGWQDTPLNHWRDLIGSSHELGHQVYRVCDGGALDWVPVATTVPCQVPSPRASIS